MTTVTDHDRQPVDDLTGQQCGGSYRIIKKIGGGGMGEVWLAQASELDDKPAAVKVLHRNAVAQPELLRRFKIEARAIGGLSDQNVVHVWDAGKLADGRHYMIMEFCSGGSLASLLERKKKLSIEDTFMFIAGVGQALAVAHAAGIIHRDVKPDNILLVNQNGRVIAKLSDFGIAKLNYERLDAQYRGGTMGALGTPGFMAPEQLDPKNGIDHRADIFSLGCVIYLCLTGQTPYPAGNQYQYIDAIVRRARFPRPRELRAEIPVELDNLIMECLEHDRAKRVQTVVEVVRRFSRILSNGQGLLQVSAPLLVDHATAPTAPTIPESIGVAGTQYASSVSESANQERRKERRKERRNIVTSFLAGILLSGATAVLAGRSWVQPAPCGELATASTTPILTTPGTAPPSIAPSIAAPASPPAPNVAPVSPARIVASTSVSNASPMTPAPSVATISIDAGIDAPRAVRAVMVPLDAHQAAVTAMADDTGKPKAQPDKAQPQPAEKEKRTQAATTQQGTLRVEVEPWADVEVGEFRACNDTTPMTCKLPVGRHRVVLKKGNQVVETLDVVITFNQTTSVKRSW